MARKSLPNPLSEEEAARLLGRLSPHSMTGLRNQVALLLMLRAGLRVSEVCNLTPGDIQLSEGRLRVHRGKGAKDRVLFLDPQLLERLTLWQARRPPKSRWLLPVIQSGTRGGGTAKAGSKIQPRYFGNLVARLAREAGIERAVSPHVLRHTYATSELRRGVPIHQLQRDLGHANLATTAVYLHVMDSERQESANGRPAMELPTC